MSQLFVDIETIPQYPQDENGIVSLPGNITELYGKRFKKEIESIKKDPIYEATPINMTMVNDSDTISFQEALNTHYIKNAALYAEFGKIACISVGIQQGTSLSITYMCGTSEYDILTAFAVIIKHAQSLVGHNSLEFDFPYLVRRMIIKGVPIPNVLNTIGRKPWEVNLEDTMKMWSSTAWNYKCSLALLAECLGLPNPKSDFDGSQVASTYYSQDPDRFKRIGNYCNGDVATTANVYRKINGQPIYQPHQIIYT